MVSFKVEDIEWRRVEWCVGRTVWMLDCVWKWAGATHGVQDGSQRSVCDGGRVVKGGSSVGGLPRGGTWSSRL